MSETENREIDQNEASTSTSTPSNQVERTQTRLNMTDKFSIETEK